MDHSPPTSGTPSGVYDSNMVNPQAALMVLDHFPDPDEVAALAEKHLEDFPAEEAHATCEIATDVPAWLEVHERDQMSAHMRDGAVCILIIYMQEGGLEEEEDEEQEI